MGRKTRRFGTHDYVLHRKYTRSMKPNPNVDRAIQSLKKKGYFVELTRGQDHYTVWKRKKPKKPLFLYDYKGQCHPTIRHRLRFGGKWFQHYHPNVTYECGITKPVAEGQAKSLRERGYNARISRAYATGGYAVYHRRRG